MDVSGSLNVGPLGTPSSGLVFQDGTFQNTAATSNVYNFGQNLQLFTQLNSYAGTIDPSFNLANLDCLNASATVQYMVACTSDSPSPSRIAMSSDYGDVWFDITSRVQAASPPSPLGPVEAIAVTLSETGQYITTVDYQGTGIYASNDYGQTFTNTTTNSIDLTSACMSYSGQYQLTVGLYDALDLSATFQSIDYGQNWTSRSTTLDSSGVSCAMSGTGQYQAICGQNTKGLYYSNNYGTDFSNITLGYPSFDISYNGVAFSYSGQYITIAPSGISGAGFGGLWVSNYYGQFAPNSWKYSALNSTAIFSLSISNTGQYQLAVPSTQSPQTNGFYISSDFGTNWTLVNQSSGSFAPSSSAPVNTSIVSSSGQRIVVWDNSYNQVYISESSPAQIAWVLDSSNNIINNTLYASVGIGHPAGPGYTLDVDGSANFAGQVYAPTFNTQSDYRIKDNITKLNDTFIVDNLNPVTYTNTRTQKQDVGFIAHELQEVYPFLVNGIKDGEQFQSVNYIGLIGILTKEIQEIKERVKTLEDK